MTRSVLTFILFLAWFPPTITLAQNWEVLAEYRVGLIGRDQNDFINQAAESGALAAALDLSHRHSIDVELLISTPDRAQGESQVLALSELFVAQVDGILISPDDSGSVQRSLEFAQNEGTLLIYFERELPALKPLTALLPDEIEAGRMAGRAILPKLTSRGRVAILTSEEPNPQLEQRLAGVREALGFRRIETIVACQPNFHSAIATIHATEEADRNDHIQGWIFLEDWPLLGMPSLPWEPGRRPVVAIQSSPSAFLYVDQGYLDTLVVHPYYEWGYQSVTAIIEKLHNDASPDLSERPLTAPRLIDWRNADEYRESWKSWLR